MRAAVVHTLFQTGEGVGTIRIIKTSLCLSTTRIDNAAEEVDSTSTAVKRAVGVVFASAALAITAHRSCWIVLADVAYILCDGSAFVGPPLVTAV